MWQVDFMVLVGPFILCEYNEIGFTIFSANLDYVSFVGLNAVLELNLHSYSIPKKYRVVLFCTYNTIFMKCFLRWFITSLQVDNYLCDSN